MATPRENKIERSSVPILQRPPDSAARSKAIRPSPEQLRPIGNQALARWFQQGEQSSRVGSGQPLDPQLRSFMQSRFGHDFSAVRIHTDSQAKEATGVAGAAAITVGQEIAVAPEFANFNTKAGRRLLAHELAHTVQQRQEASKTQRTVVIPSASAHRHDPLEREATQAASQVESGGRVSAILQRATGPQFELVGYNKQRDEVTSWGTDDPFPTTLFANRSADAAQMQVALATLIQQGKLGMRHVGDRTFFYPKGSVTERQVRDALAAARFSRAAEMAASLLDPNEARVFVSETTDTVVMGLYHHETRTKDKLESLNERPLTDAEITEARRVFGNAIRYHEIECVFNSVGSIGGYARTIYHTIHFPSKPNMPWLIHELTHVWQAERLGGKYMAKALWAQTVGDGYRYGGEAGLRAMRKAGSNINSFNVEQQGDILSDYYRRLVSGQDVTAWEPYAEDVKKL